MKKFFLFSLIFFLILLPTKFLLSQGIYYEGEMIFDETEKDSISKKDAYFPNKYQFEVYAQDGKFKMVYLSDFGFLKTNDYVLGDSLKRITYIVFPEKKSFFEMNLDDYEKISDLSQKISKENYLNKSVQVSDLPPKTIDGTLCSGKRIIIKYDKETTFLGKKEIRKIEQKSDYYASVKYDFFKIFGGINWHKDSFLTKDKELNKEIEEKVGFLGFPVYVETEVFENGKLMGKIIVKTKNVLLKNYPSSFFEVPKGYKKENFYSPSFLLNISKENTASDGSDETEEGDEKEEKKENEKEKESALEKEGKKVIKKIIKKIVK